MEEKGPSLCALLVVLYTGTATIKNGMKFSHTHTQNKTKLQYDPEIPLLDIYPPKTKTLTQKDTYTTMVIAALFATAKM